MADPISNKLVDKRVAHRYVRKNILDEKEYEKYLKALPDLADQALPIEAAVEGDDFDDDDEAEEADEVVEAAPAVAAAPATPAAPAAPADAAAPAAPAPNGTPQP